MMVYGLAFDTYIAETLLCYSRKQCKEANSIKRDQPLSLRWQNEVLLAQCHMIFMHCEILYGVQYVMATPRYTWNDFVSP